MKTLTLTIAEPWFSMIRDGKKKEEYREMTSGRNAVRLSWNGRLKKRRMLVMSKAILLSIHPKWAKKIYSGEKRVEWRKSYPKIEGKTRVYMYETAPIKRVTGFFTLLDVEGVDVNKSITLSYEKGCVSIDDLKKYQGDSMCVFAWEIKHGSVVMFDQPKTLADFGLKRPPQSWQYVEKK